jgi:hypothetical protein
MNGLCRNCQAGFTKKNYNQIFCSIKCERKYNAPETSGLKRDFGLSSSSAGAMSELLACADLLKKGYSVFRSVSPASNFDAIAFKNDKMISIEIRTGYMSKSGKLIFTKNQKDIAQHYAVVLHQKNEVVYIPELF